MSALTVSELIAEDCFSARGIRYERIPQSHVPTPDYRLLVDPEQVIAEVKEFGPSGKLRVGGFCPAATGPGRNTRVSAVLGILPIPMHRNCIEAGRLEFKLTEGFSRELTDDEVHWIHQQTSESIGQVEWAMRVVVVENPYATKALPENLFCGLLTNDGLRVPTASFA